MSIIWYRTNPLAKVIFNGISFRNFLLFEKKITGKIVTFYFKSQKSMGRGDFRNFQVAYSERAPSKIVEYGPFEFFFLKFDKNLCV